MSWEATWVEYPRICREVARSIPPSLRSIEDPEDAVMDAALVLLKSGIIPDPGLLLLTARRQLIEHYRRRNAVKRGGGIRFVSLD